MAYRVWRGLRVGAEYGGQDFEADDAEGGGHHVAGPTVSLDLDGSRYQVTTGAGFGITRTSPAAAVRVAVVGAL